MREYINSKLELYVQLSELEDAVTSQIGFENYFFFVLLPKTHPNNLYYRLLFIMIYNKYK